MIEKIFTMAIFFLIFSCSLSLGVKFKGQCCGVEDTSEDTLESSNEGPKEEDNNVVKNKPTNYYKNSPFCNNNLVYCKNVCNFKPNTININCYTKKYAHGNNTEQKKDNPIGIKYSGVSQRTTYTDVVDTGGHFFQPIRSEMENFKFHNPFSFIDKNATQINKINNNNKFFKNHKN